MIQHDYQSLKMQHQKEFPSLGSGSVNTDGFGHLIEKEGEHENKVVESSNNRLDADALNQEKINTLEKQLSEANAARQNQTYEIAKLEAEVSQSVKIDLNKSDTGSISVRATNFEYDEDSDTRVSQNSPDGT